MTPWTSAHPASLSFTIYQSLLKLMSTESVMPSNHLILCHPLLHLLSVLPSIRVFPNKLALHIRWPEYWSFSFSPSNEYSGLIFFRIDWFDLLAVQRTLKSLLQHHSSKASVLRHSAFFMVQLSHSYMTTRKTVVLTIWTFIGKVMSLLFSTLSRFAFQGASSREHFQKTQISIFFFFFEREGARNELFGKSFARKLDFRTVAFNFYILRPHPPMIIEWSHFILMLKLQ